MGGAQRAGTAAERGVAGAAGGAPTAQVTPGARFFAGLALKDAADGVAHKSVGLILAGAGRVLLIDRCYFGRPEQGWDLPGGPVEPHEALPAAARRIAWERAGLRIGRVRAHAGHCDTRAAAGRITRRHLLAVDDHDAVPLAAGLGGATPEGCHWFPAALAVVCVDPSVRDMVRRWSDAADGGGLRRLDMRKRQ